MKKILSLVLVLTLALMPMIALAADAPDIGGNIDMGVLDGFKGPIDTAISVLMAAGYIIAFVMILWLGIQWILATPAKKAELKGKLWSIAIGIVLLIGAPTILKFVWNLVSSANPS